MPALLDKIVSNRCVGKTIAIGKVTKLIVGSDEDATEGVANLSVKA